MERDFEIPVVNHPEIPKGVPLVADFNDDRNRLSYYYPRLQAVEDIRIPLTHFVSVNGNYDSYPQIDYRSITQFMQEIGVQKAFVRGDYSSGKYDGDTGSKIVSQDVYDIETVVLEMIRQLSRAKRHLGGRIAVREWIPHDREVRYFIRNGEILYRSSLDTGNEFPDSEAEKVADCFQSLSWSVDFIRHEVTGEWYCIDMGLDGLYHTGSEWIAISEHLDESQSPERYRNEMPNPSRFEYCR